MPHVVLAVVMVVAMTACAQPRAGPHLGLPLGMTHVPASELPSTPARTPPTLTRLTATVEALEAGADDLHHRHIITALGELADTLAAITPRHVSEIDAVRRAANELANSPPDSRMHANQVAYGLRHALAALAASSPIDSDDGRAYRATVTELVTELDALSTDRPLLAQHDLIVEAFRAATRSLYVLVGVEPPGAVVGRRVSAG